METDDNDVQNMSFDSSALHEPSQLASFLSRAKPSQAEPEYSSAWLDLT